MKTQIIAGNEKVEIITEASEEEVKDVVEAATIRATVLKVPLTVSDILWDLKEEMEIAVIDNRVAVLE